MDKLFSLLFTIITGPKGVDPFKARLISWIREASPEEMECLVDMLAGVRDIVNAYRMNAYRNLRR